MAWRDKAIKEAVTKRQPRVDAQVKEKRLEHEAAKAKDLARATAGKQRHAALVKEYDRLKASIGKKITPERQKQLERTIEHGRENSHQMGR